MTTFATEAGLCSWVQAVALVRHEPDAIDARRIGQGVAHGG